jgi:L-aspartate oxidase
MKRYNEAQELAPRDIVARAIVTEMHRTSCAHVYLDMTAKSEEFLKKRFPRIYETCESYGLDLASDLAPVCPAAHYMMGGVKTDLWGRTSLPGLYAAGETATTGVHGANRLASNSLLEGLVFGARAGKTMREELSRRPANSAKPHRALSNGPVDAATEALINEVQDLTWKDVGIVRTGTRLKAAIEHLNRIAPRVAHPQTRRAHEAQNILALALLVARSALAREESRGAHYRTDFPAHNDAKFLKHSILKGDSIRFA